MTKPVSSEELFAFMKEAAVSTVHTDKEGQTYLLQAPLAGDALAVVARCLTDLVIAEHNLAFHREHAQCNKTQTLPGGGVVGLAN